MVETFRIESITSFELNPAHYLSTPGYIWNAMFRFTDVWLKLVLETEKHQLIENMIRRVGILLIYKGCSEAYNKFIKSYEHSKPSTHVMYLDAKHL